MSSDAPSILVVEDDPAIRGTLVECLAYEGYSVAEAGNGAEGLQYLERAPAPKLMMVDLIMPVMNGEEFLERVKERPAFAVIPTVLMTAATPAPGEVYEADERISKPFDLSTLLGVVSRYCGPPRSR